MGVIVDLVKIKNNKYMMVKECKDIIDELYEYCDDIKDCIENLNISVIDKIVKLSGSPIKSVKYSEGYVFPDGSVAGGDFYEVQSIQFVVEQSMSFDAEEIKKVQEQIKDVVDVCDYMVENNMYRDTYSLEVYIPMYNKENKYIYTDEYSFEISKDLYNLFLEKGLKEFCEV